MSDKTVVNGLWLGAARLGPLELLTLHSFSHFGAAFHLWCYEPVAGPLPPGVTLRDGTEILPRDRIFRYPAKMILGFGENSHVGFSEIFRYKVLYEVGGWWSDMDVTCLKPLEEVRDDYFFRVHGVLSLVGNIMKVPPRSELMRRCYERAAAEVNDRQDDWHHAIRILCYHVENLGLAGFIHRDACNLDRLDMMWRYFGEAGALADIPASWRFMHWMNSVVPKKYAENSVFDRLLGRFHCKPRPIFV